MELQAATPSHPEPPPTRPVTRLEAAAECRVSPYTIDKWVREGRLKRLNYCRRVFFRRADIERLISGE